MPSAAAPTTASPSSSHHHMSPSPSTSALAAGPSASRISANGGGSTARRKVATRPVWARYDAPSPPTSPHTAAVAAPADDVPTFSTLPPPDAGSSAASGSSRAEDTASPSTNTAAARSRTPSHAAGSAHSPHPPPPRSDADSVSIRSTDEKGPKRFWTFTLPGMRWERQGRSQASGLRVDTGAEGDDEGHEEPSPASPPQEPSQAPTPPATHKGTGTINKLQRGWSHRPGPSAAGGASRQSTQHSGSSAIQQGDGSGKRPSSSGGIQKRRRDKRAASNAAAAKPARDTSDYSSSSSSDSDFDERREEDFVGSSAMRDAAASVGASGLMMPWRKGGAAHAAANGDVSSPGPISPVSQDTKSNKGNNAEEQGDSLTRSQQRHGTGDSGQTSGADDLRITIPLASPGMERNDSFTRHQPQTPGWSSPWRPSSIYEAGGEGNSIDLGGGYIFSRANGAFVPARYGEKGLGGMSGRDGTDGGSGDRRKGSRSNGGNGGSGEKGSRTNAKAARRAARKQAFEQFLLHNPFVPLLFRIVNLAFTTATLAVAIRLHQILHTEGASAAVGSSPVLAIIIACPTLVHVCSQIYLEYGSKPIGLWSVSSKLTYTMVDLIAISFWSAELSLSFDNYFTSSITCTSFNEAFLEAQGCTSVGGSLLSNPNRKGIICRLQGALIGLVFVSLVAYIVVFTVSLFRIFERVSGRRGG